jgi:hypothetical protein
MEYAALEAAQMEMPEESEEYSAVHAMLVALTAEQAALQDLVLVMQAKTLPDAAVQLSVLSDAVAEICVPDLGSLLQSGDLAYDLDRFRRVLVGLTPVVVGTAGLDQDPGDQPGIGTDFVRSERSVDRLMTDNESAPVRSVPGVLPLCGAYQALNELRIDIDQHIISMSSDVSCRGGLWLELELVLTKLDSVVDRLAKTRATHMAELRAKAKVLTTLLQSDDTGQGAIIQGSKAARLALSLAEDAAGLAG